MSAQPELVASERDFLAQCLVASEIRYLKAIDGVSEAAATVKISENSWSILECAEHVATAERQMLAMWNKFATAGKGDPVKDKGVVATASNREKKFTAPERSRPNGRYTELKAAIADFREHRSITLASLHSLSTELRRKVVQHPMAGEIDGYQLFRLMAAHAERHAAQIEEIKNHPAYKRAG
ncbi:MAG TPA: DinB family protein [Terriglobales bacterium]|nr:DinB family protein [Terriglobales bacterium]